MADQSKIDQDEVAGWLSSMSNELQGLIEARHAHKTPRIVGIKTGGVIVARELHKR